MQVSNPNPLTLTISPNPAITNRILLFLDKPAELYKYRLINKEWAAEVKKITHLALIKLRKEILSFRKDTTVQLTDEQEIVVCRILPLLKGLPDLFSATPFTRAADLVELKALRTPLEVCFHVFLTAGALFIDSETWKTNYKKWSKRLSDLFDDSYPHLQRNSLRNFDFYLNIPKECIDNAEKSFKDTPFTLDRARKASNGVYNYGKWYFSAVKAGKLALKLSEEAKSVVKEFVNDVPEHLTKEFNRIYMIKESYETDEVRKYFEQKLIEYNKEIEEAERRVKEKDIEVVTLKMACQNLAVVMKELQEQHKKDKIRQFQEKKAALKGK